MQTGHNVVAVLPARIVGAAWRTHAPVRSGPLMNTAVQYFLPDAATAKAVTGYERGTITPLGSTTAWPVVIDSAITGPISIGGGGHGVGITVDVDALADALSATRAEISEVPG